MNKISKWRLFLIGWALVLAGGGLAHLIQTAGGIQIQDVRFEFEPGKNLAALLYRPQGASAETPAPGILAVHGYINSRETQSGFAIEFARRGYVVLAIDQTGHGFSEGAAFSAGFGGPAALRYLRSLPFVDPGNIGLEGHSMGGWTSLAAAADQPQGYRAIALVGSSTGAPFAAPGTPTIPRNLGVIFSRYDEFSELMWGVPVAADITRSGKLKAVFGTEQEIEVKRLYGSIESGTGRWLAVPATTHPGDHLSGEAIADTLTWMNMALDQPTPGDSLLPVQAQIWHWKEFGTLVALLGGVLVLLGSFELALRLRPFSGIARMANGAVVHPDGRWWAALALTAAIPALTYFPLTALGAAFTAGPIFSQGVTNQILVWALGNAAIALLLAVLFARRALLREKVPKREESRRDGGRLAALAAHLIVALISITGLYLAVMASDRLFKTDMRFWVVALKPMATHHLPLFATYLLPFTLFFYVTQRIWQQTASLETDPVTQYAASLTATVAGILIMVLVIYAYLLVVGRLPGVDPLFSIVAIQFVPVLAITSIVSVFTWRRTGDATAGALISGLFVTWYIVAGQATQVA